MADALVNDDDPDLRFAQAYAAARLMIEVGTFEVRQRLADLDDAINELELAKERARFCRWRALLMMRRLERAAVLAARVRDRIHCNPAHVTDVHYAPKSSA